MRIQKIQNFHYVQQNFTMFPKIPEQKIDKNDSIWCDTLNQYLFTHTLRNTLKKYKLNFVLCYIQDKGCFKIFSN